MAHDIGLTHIALPVTNLAESIAFYAKYANLQVVHQRPRVVWVSDRTRPFVVVLIQTDKVDTPLQPFAHLGVACESREAVDRLCELARSEDRLVAGPKDYGPPVGYWAFIAPSTSRFGTTTSSTTTTPSTSRRIPISPSA
jgi:catechol 2,3-dioxygenase-like lactoylglutathione lyase family enzyme